MFLQYFSAGEDFSKRSAPFHCHSLKSPCLKNKTVLFFMHKRRKNRFSINLINFFYKLKIDALAKSHQKDSTAEILKITGDRHPGRNFLQSQQNSASTARSNV